MFAKGCSYEVFPSSYLGLPLGGKANTKSKWAESWKSAKRDLLLGKKACFLKKAKLTLIKTVLPSIPVYYFSLFMAPQSVIKHIEKAIRDFLWRDGDNGKKHNWVTWATGLRIMVGWAFVSLTSSIDA